MFRFKVMYSFTYTHKLTAIATLLLLKPMIRLLTAYAHVTQPDIVRYTELNIIIITMTKTNIKKNIQNNRQYNDM